MDTLTPEQRSVRMARIRSKGTRPEWFVRRLVFSLGYRYRLHRRELPGSPDLVFANRRRVIFVHGCFWHLHAACRLARIPKTKKRFWVAKLTANRRRDLRDRRALTRGGWKTLVVWECQLRSRQRLERKIVRFLAG
ncbi:MAG: very short patch repair endonuclease [Terriglobales bacterium]